ncbi:hypothetical protein ABEB36_014070 [Hypothenemus hampei]|uniref:Uncharacterized protein n=1 Tax=Hypothenemus hampei TaxID=57062 RepID=A0ABD1E378_HYPHA
MGGCFKKCAKKTPFQVYRMKRDDFYNISGLKQFFVQPTKFNTGGFGIKNAVRITFSTSDLYTMYISDSYNEDMHKISLKKRGRPSSLNSFQGELTKKYNAPLPIEKTKLEHVISCLRWIPEIYHDFYKGLHQKEN